ncbi:MAG: hypothetical protein LBT05_14765 [Planctomycetaceae bacterium]|jgi:hypothetical protein|nr:hypothetical protein [Planctomycetaceae bacterium]
MIFTAELKIPLAILRSLTLPALFKTFAPLCEKTNTCYLLILSFKSNQLPLLNGLAARLRFSKNG